MGFSSVLVVGGSAAWEQTLIRGVLAYFDIPSTAVDHRQADEFGADALRILLRPRPAQMAPAPTDPPGQVTVLAGRHFTIEHLHGRVRPTEREALVYGEPYALIPQLARRPGLLEGLRGQAVLGPLLDPRHYRTPAPTGAASVPVPLLTSVGCQKRCGYCAYGATYACLYPAVFGRRSRPWQDLFAEIVAFGRTGSRSFALLADQVLARPPQENHELQSLASHWVAAAHGRPSLTFTVAPPEALESRPLLELLGAGFELHPTLSIDSLDDEALSAFGMPFDASEALEAARMLSELGMAFRLNYIFVRPGMTAEGLARELANLVRLADIVGPIPPEQQLLLARDIFSGRFVAMPGSPLWGLRSMRDYEQDLDLAVLRSIVKIQGVVADALEAGARGRQGDPLRAIIESAAEVARVA